jgi:hypothetical protein
MHALPYREAGCLWFITDQRGAKDEIKGRSVGREVIYACWSALVSGGRPQSPQQSNGTPRTRARCSGNGAIGKCIVPSQSETRPEGRSEVNLKTHSAPNSNIKKKPNDSDDDAMTGARASCLKTRSEECGESGRRQSGLTRSRRSQDPRNDGKSP